MAELLGIIKGGGAGLLTAVVYCFWYIKYQSKDNELKIEKRLEEYAHKSDMTVSFTELKAEVAKIDDKVDKLQGSMSRIEGRLNNK